MKPPVTLLLVMELMAAGGGLRIRHIVRHVQAHPWPRRGGDVPRIRYVGGRGAPGLAPAGSLIRDTDAKITAMGAMVVAPWLCRHHGHDGAGIWRGWGCSHECSMRDTIEQAAERRTEHVVDMCTVGCACQYMSVRVLRSSLPHPHVTRRAVCGVHGS
jgi:hypothetical protein